ncbi:ICMT-domain-containing protein [Meredithblackwellia eburnea MCA 4105]
MSSKTAQPTADMPPMTPPATSETSSSAPPKGQKMAIELPLTSFASTPHNVACISFLLGGLWATGLVSTAYGLLNHKQVIWSTSEPASSLQPQSLTNAILSPYLGLYLSCWAFFHLMEFVVTSTYNAGKLSVSSFLLNNGAAYHIAHAIGILEYILEEAYFPPEWRKYKHFGSIALLGWGLVVGGQIIRSYAMISASSNFSHIVAVSKLPSHQLVKTGIYSWSRHPSYAGFTWWAVGTQIFLGNPFATIAFAIVVYKFFSYRIRMEEIHLVQFFGDDYIKYRQQVPTRILFIS